MLTLTTAHHMPQVTTIMTDYVTLYLAIYSVDLNRYLYSPSNGRGQYL